MNETTDEISGFSKLFIERFVAIFTKSPLRTAAFTIVTVGGGVGLPAANGFPFGQTVAGVWAALFGTVIVVEAIHGLPTVGESE